MSFPSLPEGWLATTLGSLIELKYGKSLPAQNRDGKSFPVYGSNGVVGSHSVPLVDCPGLIVGRKGSYGEVQFSNTPFFPIDTTYYVDEFYGLPIRYWYYQLRYLPLTELNRSTAIPGLNREDAYAQNISLPPLAEQKVIADKLDTLLGQVDNTKARLERIPEILKSFRQSVLAAAVTGKLTEEWRSATNYSLDVSVFSEALLSFKSKAKDLGLIQQKGKWVSCQLGHVISVRSGDGLTAKEMAPEGHIPVYGGNGVNGYHNKSNVTDSVIAIGRVGFYCGSVHLTENLAWVTDNALIVDFTKQLFSRDFMYLLLRATDLREDSASTAQPVISGTKIYPIKIDIPPIEEQIEIVRRVEELFAYADRIEQAAQAAQSRVNNLTQSILAKAFRGELTADWRAANPDLIRGDKSAEALLAKIKAERAKVSKKTKAKA